MAESIIPGLRNLRSAFLSGALLLGSLWLLFASDGKRGIKLRRSARDILHLSSSMKLILAGVACFIVGSVLTTSLEGLVDWIHRRQLWKPAQPDSKSPRARIDRAIAPLSPKARDRAFTEACDFYDDLSKLGAVSVSEDRSPIDRSGFATKVLEDLLWMEGKLAGTVQQAPFEQYRSEGELRLSTAVLLPLTAVAGCYALKLHAIPSVLAVTLSIAAAIVLGNYGFYEYRRANSFVAHHVADGVLLTPTMETAQRLSNRPRP